MIELARSHVYLNTPKNYHECTKSVDKGKSVGAVWHGNARSFEINEMQWILQYLQLVPQIRCELPSPRESVLTLDPSLKSRRHGRVAVAIRRGHKSEVVRPG
jgi:hypothetical protein